MKAVTSLTLATFAAAILPLAAPSTALASRNAQTDPFATDSSKLKQKSVDCDSFCSEIVNDGNSQNFRWNEDRSKVDNSRLKGVGAYDQPDDVWDAEDDEWCAEHYEQTEAAIAPSGPRPGSPMALPSGAPKNAKQKTHGMDQALLEKYAGKKSLIGNCPYFVSAQMTEKDLDRVTKGNATQICEEIGKGLKRCQYKNTVYEEYCLAYSAAKDGVHWQWILFALDSAAAIACGVECTSQAASLGTFHSGICSGAGIAASAGELTATIAMKEGPVATALNGLGAAIGTTISGFHFGSAKGMSNEQGWNKDTALACVATGFFAIMAGVRTYNLHAADSTKDDACDNLKKLQNQENTMKDGNGSPNVNYANGAPMGLGSSGGTGGSATGSGGSAQGGSRDAADEKKKNENLASLLNGERTNATDAEAIKRSGLLNPTANAAKNLPFSSTLDKLKSGGAGQMLGSMAGGTGLPAEVGAAMAALADAAQKNPHEVGAVGGATYSQGGGGGGGSGGGSGNSGGGLGGLFAGFGGNQGPMGGNSVAQFGSRGPAADDIWHSGTQLSIFEIVSGKIEKVSNRVSGAGTARR